MKTERQIINLFWEAVPDKTTMAEMADGIDVAFTYKGKTYTVNTRIEKARTKSFETCYSIWENKAVNAVSI